MEAGICLTLELCDRATMVVALSAAVTSLPCDHRAVLNSPRRMHDLTIQDSQSHCMIGMVLRF